MLIAFVGDVHGRMFHAIAALVALQERMAARFDLIVQVGDLGFPDPARGDEMSKRYLEVDPAEADLGRFLRADGRRADALRRVRERLGKPVHFVRGNHEDFAWLAGLPVDPATGTAPTDPLDLLHYVPDGTVLDIDGYRIAFLGGVEELPGEPAIDMRAYESLINEAPRSIDLLVTHEGPYGSGKRFGGEVAGSRGRLSYRACWTGSSRAFTSSATCTSLSARETSGARPTWASTDSSRRRSGTRRRAA
ncbi:MAG: metallophosphoesterase [Dehalococcoidia bacterium]